MEWRQITGWPYEVSEDGQVRRSGSPKPGVRVGRILGVQIINGYAQVQLRDRPRRRWHRKVHHLVMEAFIGSPPTPKHQTNHKDGDKSNNHWTNLEWTTARENINHADALGLRWFRRGEEHTQAKLKEADVLRIRRFLSLGRSMTAIAKEFNVDRKTIYNIKRNVIWRHVR